MNAPMLVVQPTPGAPAWIAATVELQRKDPRRMRVTTRTADGKVYEVDAYYPSVFHAHDDALTRHSDVVRVTVEMLDANGNPTHPTHSKGGRHARA